MIDVLTARVGQEKEKIVFCHLGGNRSSNVSCSFKAELGWNKAGYTIPVVDGCAGGGAWAGGHKGVQAKAVMQKMPTNGNE